MLKNQKRLIKSARKSFFQSFRQTTGPFLEAKRMRISKFFSFHFLIETYKNSFGLWSFSHNLNEAKNGECGIY